MLLSTRRYWNFFPRIANRFNFGLMSRRWLLRAGRCLCAIPRCRIIGCHSFILIDCRSHFPRIRCMSSRSKTFRLEIARPRRRNSAGFIYPVRMRLKFGRKTTITVNQWRWCIHHGELLFPALQCITFPDAVGNVSRLNTHLIPCMLLEGGWELKAVLSVQLANCIRMALQVTEGIDVGAGDNVLGPSIIRSLSLILPP